jgi:hypothetical protein
MTRGRFSWLATGIAALVIAGILILQQLKPDRNPDPKGPPVSAVESPVRRTGHVATSQPKSSPAALSRLPYRPPAIQPPYPTGSPENQDWITKRIAELEALTWYDDPESLAKILTELRNPLPEIRTAALAAIKDFDSRDAIPYLEAIARDTTDPLEQKLLTDTVERLRLPTLVEHLDAQVNAENEPDTDRR